MLRGVEVFHGAAANADRVVVAIDVRVEPRGETEAVDAGRDAQVDEAIERAVDGGAVNFGQAGTHGVVEGLGRRMIGALEERLEHHPSL